MDDHQMGDTFLSLALGIDQARHAHWRSAQGQEHLKRDALLREQFEQKLPWGLEASIDLFACNPTTIRDPDKIHAFAVALCDFIQMRRYGDPWIVHFGQEERVSGYTLIQLIETSNICSHFIEQGNAGCLTIFSCAYFPPYAAARFCQEWFGAQEVEVAVTFRGPTQAVGQSSLEDEEKTRASEGGNVC